MVEFKRVHVRIGQSVRYAPSAEGTRGDGEVGKRRMHRVDTYLRTYRAGRDKPLVRVVESFWRGDPKLGIVYKQKHVHK
jgi:hypothetical protein